jgi:hypothetical protein
MSDRRDPRGTPHHRVQVSAPSIEQAPKTQEEGSSAAGCASSSREVIHQAGPRLPETILNCA